MLTPVDPDFDDNLFYINVQLGGLKDFTSGRYPKYQISPISNETDSGNFEIIITLGDDNPLPM